MYSTSGVYVIGVFDRSMIVLSVSKEKFSDFSVSNIR